MSNEAPPKRGEEHKATIPDKCRMTIKGLVTGPSMEYGDHGAFVCHVYFDNKKVARIFEAGNGGCLDIDIINQMLFDQMTVYFNDVVLPLNPPTPYSFDESKLMHYDMDMFYFRLVEKFEEDKTFKRQCRNKTLVITKDCGPTEHYAYKAKFSPDVKAQMIKLHGDDLVEIINERYL